MPCSTKCPSTHQLLTNRFPALQNMDYLGDFMQASMDIMAKDSKDTLSEFILITWGFWIRRNKMVHDQLNLPPQQVIATTLAKTLTAEIGLSLNYFPGLLLHNYRWSAPPKKALKLNIDGALYFDSNKSRIGIILRDQEGETILPASGPTNTILEPEHIEAHALVKGLQLCLNLGISHLVVESDCLFLVNKVNKSNSFSSSIRSQVAEIKELMQIFPQCNLQYCNRLYALRGWDTMGADNLDGVNYFHVKVIGLLFVATTRNNLSPSLVLELLQRIARVIKDYLGVLSEESLRKNFVLVYELLDEVMDFGYVQTTSTEVLKSYIFNEPIVVDTDRLSSLGPAALFVQGAKRMPGTAVTKSVVAHEPGGRKREEIFVDIIEKISVTFSSSGYILTSEIDGTIQMKSYLTGNPEIRLALNDDLSIGRGGRSIYDHSGSSGSGSVILDDCNFHESVHLDSFDVDRTLTLVPSDGEFPVMNYRITQEFKPPFRINSLIEEAGPLKAEVILKIYAEFPSSITANTIVVEMPLPTYTTRVNYELEPGAVGQMTDFKESNRRLEWSLKKIVGGSEHTLRAKLTCFQESHGNITKEAGPVSMTFTIPMYNPSRLQVKYLQIAKKTKTSNPYRWVRYVTQANSYVARI
ncbi:AP-4 complex subunit mu-like [Olea europaea var. sylvestris]|uniref:AP-4 complex subunit mu-like n=1 Tax=Olea europaea var. sylvestris TaxID=158386 RepID=UPI000C1D6033|nr:AP-4 complex subunit mu-like [Olea europaea var. sylvestris]